MVPTPIQIMNHLGEKKTVYDEFFVFFIVQTEQAIVHGNNSRKRRRRNSQEMVRIEPNPPSPFHLKCENGRKLNCPGNMSNETLNEKCKGILMFSENDTSSHCECQDPNQPIRTISKRSSSMSRSGWTKWTRYL